METSKLVRAAGKEVGRQTSLEEAYARLSPGLFRLAFVLNGDREVAADVVQDAFIRVFGKFAQLRGDAVVEAYLRRTVINLSNSRFRRRAVERRVLASQRPPAEAIASVDVDERQDVIQQLAGLPHRQRAAVVLRFLEDLDEKEVAAILGTSPKAVNSLVGRALKTLRGNGGDDGSRT